MATSVDTSRLNVDKTTGRTSFSGLGSGIDFEGAVNSMVEAKKIPLTRLQDTVKTNNDKIKSYTDLNSKLSGMRDSLNKLRGVISADKSNNIFYTKETFASSSRNTSLLNNPNRTTASAAASLIGVSVTNVAEKGSYNVEILRTAKAQKDASQVLTSVAQQDRSDSFTSSSTALNTLDGTFAGGTFIVNGKSVSIAATDTLEQVKDKINAVADIGVTATISNPGAGDYRLVITNTTPGNTTTYSDDATNDTLTKLGILDGADAIKNQVSAPLNAKGGPLNTVIGGFAGGSFSINGKSISIDATNTLQDLRDRINAAGAGVIASIISSSGTDNYLVISANDTGTTINYSDPANVLASIGVLNNDDSVKNSLQAAQTAKLSALGLRDLSRKQSDIIYNPGATIANLAPGLVTSGAQSFTLTGGATSFSVNYDDTMTTNQLITAINTAAGIAGSDITASLETVEGGNGGYRLVIKDASGDNVSMSADTGGLVSAMAFTDPKIIERASNTVNDLIPGMTLNLFAAEGGTTIKIDVEQNLSEVKNQIAEFVKSYNDLIEFMNQQTYVDPVTGKPTEDSGILYGESTLADIKQRVNSKIASAIKGVSGAFSVLGNIGIKFVNNNEVTDPFLYNTLKVDEAKLDDALLNNADDVRKLFTFDSSTNDSRFTVTGFGGNMEYNAGGIAINFTHDGTKFTAADIGGDSSAVEINGNSLIIKSGPAAGMTMFYNGSASSGIVTASYTTGFAAQMFGELDKILTTDTGSLDAEIKTLKKLNTTYEERISTLNDRIETFRQAQLEKFYKLEQAMSNSKSIIDSIKQTTQAGQNNN